jgi:CheY-like chemotaxis protein
MVGNEAARYSGVVLSVEDDVLLRMVTASNLRDAGFEVIEAVNAAEASLRGRTWHETGC